MAALFTAPHIRALAGEARALLSPLLGELQALPLVEGRPVPSREALAGWRAPASRLWFPALPGEVPSAWGRAQGYKQGATGSRAWLAVAALAAHSPG